MKDGLFSCSFFIHLKVDEKRTLKYVNNSEVGREDPAGTTQTRDSSSASNPEAEDKDQRKNKRTTQKPKPGISKTV